MEQRLRDLAASPSVIRVAVACLGAGALITGAVAVFGSSNDNGTASLVAVGAGLLALAGLWDRIHKLKVGAFEMEMLQRAQQLFDQAEQSEQAGEPEKAAELRSAAETLMQQVTPLATGYEDIRRTMQSGPARTAQMQAVFDRARVEARSLDLEPSEVRTLIDGTEGERIFALAAMREREGNRDFQALLNAVREPRKPFDHYQALLLAELMAPTLADEDRQELVRAICSHLRPRDTLRGDTSRWIVAHRILRSLDADCEQVKQNAD
jgi:hypothetical protein